MPPEPWGDHHLEQGEPGPRSTCAHEQGDEAAIDGVTRTPPVPFADRLHNGVRALSEPCGFDRTRELAQLIGASREPISEPLADFTQRNPLWIEPLVARALRGPQMPPDGLSPSIRTNVRAKVWSRADR
ncbi:hypothetical protein GCM10009727_11330 [Actinomadura napierensis]|uniref:Uncharacterized protein n=1 Tax=Actinomadura napierensis TaxID=267854 RepID=A0ABP5JXR5_9ACTN